MNLIGKSTNEVAMAVRAGELDREEAGRFPIERTLRKLEKREEKEAAEAGPDATSDDEEQG